MLGYEVIAQRLVALGVDTVFAVMGDGNLLLLAELSENHGVRIVHARHEAGAVGMADGYHRMTGRLGVATVTHGPGFTNAATSVATATAHRSKVLVLVGGLAAGDVFNLQRLDQSAFTRSLGAERVSLSTPQRVDADVLLAARTALRKPGTVVLDIPTDVQGAETGITSVAEHDLLDLAPWLSPHPELVARAASALASADRPVLLAGRGASGDRAITEIAALADESGARIVTSLLGKGNFWGHPLALGVAGGLGNAKASAALAEADCIVSFGASLNEWTTTRHSYAEGCTIVQIDTDPMAFERFSRVDVAVPGDATSTASGIRAALATVGAQQSAEAAQRAASPSAQLPPDTAPEGGHSDGDSVDPRRACAAFNAALATSRAVVVDGGHVCIWGTQLIDVHEPRSYTHGFSFGSIGQSLSLALGAAAGLDGRPVVAVMGDGSAAMSIAELETAVRERLPVIVLILNDGGFGIERHTLAMLDKPVTESNYPAPDFARMANALGASGVVISNERDLQSIGVHLARSGPIVFDIRVNGDLIAQTFLEIKQLRR